MDADEMLERALEQHRNGQLAAAAKLYQEILRGDPDNADALYLFGCMAYQSDNFEAARELLERAVLAAGNQAEYQYALGLALNALKDFTGAARSFRKAWELDQEHARALGGLADALLDAGRADEAVVAFRRLTVLEPTSARAWYGLGCAENALGEFALARGSFARAVELEPDWLEARHNLGRALYEIGLVTEAFAEFRTCSEMDRAGSEQSRAMMAVIVPGVPDASNAVVLETRRDWVSRDLAKWSRAVKVGSRHRRIRVGYVSSFFQRDNWMKPVWGLINQHDRRAVSVCLLSDCSAAAIRNGYREDAEDVYVDTSAMSNDQVAAMVAERGIDILVDLNGYSNMRRLPLFANKIAPVTIGWFNMYATTGLDGFDYLIGDPDVIPVEDEPYYSEKILRVAGSYLTFDVSYPVPDVTARPDRPIVFGALASQYKITDEVVEAWSRILRACPESSLLVKNKQMGSASGREFFIERFARHGIGAERLRLEGGEAHFDFLRAYERIDVALDTFPYNGGTTTTEAIWQGVPVVTFYGDRWASRTSASILRAGGLGDFVVSDVDEYVDLAVSLAKQRDRLAELRLAMRGRLAQSVVCDTGGFASQIERFYQCL